MLRTSRALLVATLVGVLAPLVALPATASTAYDAPVDISFPVPDLADRVYFSDDYEHARGGGSRVHRATDIGHRDAYGLPVHAARGGTVTRMTGVTSPVPSYGYAIEITGDDGRRYTYIHLGRQAGTPAEAYAPGLPEAHARAVASGQRIQVRRGQHIGYVGHSGNASESFPHLHFEIEDPAVTDPHGGHRLNPYASLIAALDRGDVPRGAAPRRTSFSDVMGGHPHGASIRAIAEAGITQGCTADRFCPSRTVTRGQMATFLQRALQLPTATGRPFHDVPSSHAHAKAIAAVAEAGIARGDGHGRFHPDAPVKRDQMASLLAGALELAPSRDRPFADVPADSVHAGAIGALAAEGIARGGSDGNYHPSRAIDRGQMASFLQRAFLG